MQYVFPYDPETLAFQAVMVRSRLKLGDKPVKLKPETTIEVMDKTVSDKVRIREAELIENGMAHRFLVELQEAFTLPEYRDIVLGRRPLALRVTLFPDLALPLPTAGVPTPAVSPAIAGTVSIGMPEAAIGRIEALLDEGSPPGERDFYVKARVHLPRIIANRADLEQKYTMACRFSTETQQLTAAEPVPAGQWARAHLTLAPTRGFGSEGPAVLPVTVTADLDGMVLEQKVFITVHPARQLELQLSRDQVRTALNKAVELKVSALEVLEDGTRIPADDVSIHLKVSAALAEVTTIAPDNGQGKLKAKITQTAVSKVTSGELLIEARARDGAILKSIPLHLVAGRYVLTLEPEKKPQDALPAAPLSISWDAERGTWRCDPVRLRLKWGLEGQEVPERIADVDVGDSQGWLEIRQMEYHGEEGCVVVLGSKQDRLSDISPPETDAPVIQVVETLPEPQAPWRALSTLVTFSAYKEQGDAAAAAAVQDEFTVQPPEVCWQTRQETPLRLSGAQEQAELEINSGDLPPGWDRAVEILVAFDHPTWARKRGLALAAELVLPGGQQADALARLRGQIKMSSQTLCLRKLKTIEADPDPEPESLFVVLRGPYYGVTGAEWVVFNVQPQLVALYLGTYPCEDYPWHEAKRHVQVIRDDQTAPTPWSTLPLSLRHLSEEGWPAPPVHWRFAEEQPGGDTAKQLDDRFLANGPEGEYIAPRQEKWAECNNPSQRAILCHIGPGDEPKWVDEEIDPDLYLAAVIPATLTLAEALPKITVQVKARPKGLPDSADSLDIRDRGIYDALNRTFMLEVDLQRLPLDRRKA